MVATETAVQRPDRRPQATLPGRRTRGTHALDLARPVLIFVVSRITLAAVLRGTALFPPKSNVMHILGSWDAAWYVQVARHGYPSHVPVPGGDPSRLDVAFFPLFPLLIRALHAVTPLTWPWSGLILSTLFGLTATLAFWRLTCRLAGRDAADRATLLFCFFPGSIVFTMFYAEGLMLTLAILSLDALIRRRWVLAGVLAGLATATRPNAVVLVICCAWAAFFAIWRHRDFRSLIALVLSPMGLIAYFGYLKYRTGSATAWFKAEHLGWAERVDFGGNTIHRFGMALSHPWVNVNNVVATVGVVLVIAAIPFFVKTRLPAVLVVFTVGVVLLGIWSHSLGERPRFVLTAFPIFMVLGIRLRSTVHSLVLATSASMLAIGMVLVAQGLIVP